MLLGRRGRKGNEDKCLFKIQWKVSEHLTKNTLAMSLDARYHLFCIVFEITTRCLCLPGNITGANSSKLPISTRFLKAYLHMCSKRAFEFSSCGLWGVCLKFWSMLWAHLYVFWSWPEYKEQGFNRIKTTLMLWSSSTLLGYEESKERSSEMEVGFDWAGKGSLRLCRGKLGVKGIVLYVFMTEMLLFWVMKGVSLLCVICAMWFIFFLPKVLTSEFCAVRGFHETCIFPQSCFAFV